QVWIRLLHIVRLSAIAALRVVGREAEHGDRGVRKVWSPDAYDALKYAQQTAAPLPAYLMRDSDSYDLSREEDLRAYLARVVESNPRGELTAALNSPDIMYSDMDPTLQRMGLKPTDLVFTQLDRITAGTSDVPSYDNKKIIDANLSSEIDAIRQRGVDEGWDNRTKVLKFNEYIVNNYGAFGLRNPDFGWTQVGANMAHQVRAEYLNTWNILDKMREGGFWTSVAVPGNDPINVITQLLSANEEASFNDTLINAQLAVFKDVFSQATYYEKYGATAALEMARVLPAQNEFQQQQSVSAFERLVRAESLQKSGDTAGAASERVRAAGALGFREQNLLQNILWNNQRFKQMAGVSDWLVRHPAAQIGPLAQLARPLNIFIGVPGNTDSFFITPPLSLPNQNASDEMNRRSLASNAFRYMGAQMGNSVQRSKVMGFFYALSKPANLYQTYEQVLSVDKLRPKWPYGGH
ncbi:MAG: hypothetical protein ACREXR_05700, partial [Gammaproteobacteria bacterium]